MWDAILRFVVAFLFGAAAVGLLMWAVGTLWFVIL